MADIIVDVPYPPSANRLWRKSRYGMYKTKTYNMWLQSCVYHTRRSGKNKTITGNFAARILLHPPDRRHSDIDNRVKGLLDMAQVTNLIENDHFCQKLDVVYDRETITKGWARLILSSW